MRCVLALLLLFRLFVDVTLDDWCGKKCGDQKHLRCEHYLRTSNEKCSIKTGFSPIERMLILDAHNRWRDYVASGLGRVDNATGDYMVFLPSNTKELQSVNALGKACLDDPDCSKKYYLWQDLEGPAADMRQLVWDYDLEDNAAIWASQCVPNNTRPYHCAFTEKFPLVHMNTDPSNRLDPTSGGFVHFLRFISYPDNYFKGDRVKLVKSYIAGIWDPFYALIYSQTYAIGCSKSVCDCKQDQYPFGNAQCGSITCVYGPSFDKTSSKFRIYEADVQPCSRCSRGTSCKPEARYKYLCARTEDPLYPSPIPGYHKPPSMFPKHVPGWTNLCFGLVMTLITF